MQQKKETSLRIPEQIQDRIRLLHATTTPGWEKQNHYLTLLDIRDAVSDAVAKYERQWKR